MLDINSQVQLQRPAASRSCPYFKREAKFDRFGKGVLEFISPFTLFIIDRIGHLRYIVDDQYGQLGRGRKGIITINSIFNSLKLEKQELIINAAIKEFVKSGFEKASTNEIVKEAKISKGSLFNYFYSKKDLYLFLIENGVLVIEKIYKEIDFNETDIFKRIEKLGLKKLHIQKKFPQVFDFLTSLAHEESEEVKEDIEHKVNSIFEEGVAKIYENIDYSKFREDIDIQKAIDILNWTMFGFGERAVNQLYSFEDVGEQYIEEWESYSKILKYSFYKYEEDEI